MCRPSISLSRQKVKYTPDRWGRLYLRVSSSRQGMAVLQDQILARHSQPCITALAPPAFVRALFSPEHILKAHTHTHTRLHHLHTTFPQPTHSVCDRRLLHTGSQKESRPPFCWLGGKPAPLPQHLWGRSHLEKLFVQRASFLSLHASSLTQAPFHPPTRPRPGTAGWDSHSPTLLPRTICRHCYQLPTIARDGFWRAPDTRPPLTTASFAC